MNRFFTLLLAASCLTAVGQVESICGCENENSLSVNLNLVAPEGFKLGEVLFASYGTPTGDCENGFATSDCHYSTTVSVIESYMSDCTTLLSVYPNNHVFGDPCGGTNKKLCVEIALEPVVTGCMNADACNYNPAASCDNGTCASCEALATACGVGTVWDPISLSCIIANPADINLDGCVQLNDLLDLLSAYGDCGAEESGWQCGDPLEYQGYEYETVQIGDQCWFAENLRSENYENGDAIPAGLSDSEWSSTASGAAAVYGEDAGCQDYSPDIYACDPTQSLNEYGRLYNWFAVDDARGLCPGGWHVPTDGEWMTMEIYLGMTEIEANTIGNRGTDQGAQMKLDYGWLNGNNGTNSSGFSGLPGGNRDFSGSFYLAGGFGYWWTSSPNGLIAWGRFLGYDSGRVNRFDDYFTRRVGFSVRCVRDAE